MEDSVISVSRSCDLSLGEAQWLRIVWGQIRQNLVHLPIEAKILLCSLRSLNYGI